MALSEFGAAAVAYAERGWAVFPLIARDKVPAIHGGCRSALADPVQARAWWSANPRHNVGIACGAVSDGLVVIDIDVDESEGEDGRETLARWEDEHGALPPTATAVTGRGGMYLFFHVGHEVRNSANKALGVDVRGDGGYLVAPPSVHPNGRRYTWRASPEEVGVAEADANVLAFLDFVRPAAATAEARPGGTSGPRFTLPEEIGAGARNDTLFRYASSLQAQGKDDAHIRAAVEAVNGERCFPPLPQQDIEKILGSVCSRYEKGRPRAFRKLDKNGNPTGPVRHNVVARELIDAHRACIIDGAPAIWDGKRYATGWQEINRATIDLLDDCKMADQKEVRNYILHMAPETKASSATLMGFANGVLDLERGLVPQAADMVITNIIPHSYRVDAYDEAADRFLDRISCGRAEVRANLEETIGMCMYRSNEFGQCPVLIGSGSNGKSTFILALRNVLGNENVSSLDINVVGKQFQAGRLLGKLANLGDDISNERLNGDVLSVFKKVVTGEWIYSDVKNGEGFEFRPYCTLVFSCNEFPSLGDSSEGMMRRLFPIPFEASFSKSDPDYDPRIWEKLTSSDAAEYLVRVGVEGLRRLIAQNGMTPNGRSDALAGEVRADNDSVLSWIEDEMFDCDSFAEAVIAWRYEDYKAWCESSGLRPFGRQKFTRKINERYGFESVVAKRQFGVGVKTVRVFRLRGES